MKSLIFLGPGVKFDARQRFGKDRPEYIFWSPDAREAPYGAEVDLDGTLAPRGEAGKAREVTNEEAEDLLSFPRLTRMDFRFVEADAVEQPVTTEPQVATAAPRPAEEITAEVARELGQEPATTRRARAPREES